MHFPWSESTAEHLTVTTKGHEDISNMDKANPTDFCYIGSGRLNCGSGLVLPWCSWPSCQALKIFIYPKSRRYSLHDTICRAVTSYILLVCNIKPLSSHTTKLLDADMLFPVCNTFCCPLCAIAAGAHVACGEIPQPERSRKEIPAILTILPYQNIMSWKSLFLAWYSYVR